jgi:hypothetical protein
MGGTGGRVHASACVHFNQRISPDQVAYLPGETLFRRVSRVPKILKSALPGVLSPIRT